MPTVAQRRGDFSDSPVGLIDPETGLPFAGNAIPDSRISAQARALLRLLPGAEPGRGERFQLPGPGGERNRSGQPPGPHHPAPACSGSAVRHGLVSTHLAAGASVFGFVDSTRNASLDVAVNWSHRFSPLFTRQDALSAHAALGRRRAVLRVTHERLRRSGHHRQRPGSGELGTAGARLRQRHRRARQRAVQRSIDDTHTWRGHRCGLEPRPSLRHVRRRRRSSAARHVRSRTRAGRSRSPARRPDRDLADFLLGIPHTSSHRVRQRRQAPARDRSTTRTSTTTFASSPALTAQRSACDGSTKSPLTESSGAW